MRKDPLALIASNQRALATLRDLLGAGLSRSAIKRMLCSGRLVLVSEGVYRVGGAPVTREQLLLAACLGAGAGAAVSHRSAAALHGLWSSPADLLEITVPPDRSPALPGVTAHRIGDLTSRWITVVRGIEVTTPARTLVDSGAVLPPGAVARMLDRAVGRQITSPREVHAAMTAVARRGRTGVGVIRRLLAERLDGPAVESVLQARMLALLRLHGAPIPVSEHTILDAHGGFVGRADFAYPELKYAIEVDGYESHSPLAAFRHDRVRQNDIVDLGWLLHRFTWREVDALSWTVADRIQRARSRILRTQRSA